LHCRRREPSYLLRHIAGLVAAMTESELRMQSEKIFHHALG
jgi:hypothetical protein